MTRLRQIQRGIIPFKKEDLPNNTVGIGTRLDKNGKAIHSGLIIGHKGIYVFFHYEEGRLKMDPCDLLPYTIYYNETSVVDERLIPSFKAYCIRIKKETKPSFGLIFDGSFFNKDGTYYSSSGLRLMTTCVGFTILVLNGFMMENKYIEDKDWDSGSADSFRKERQEYADFYVAHLKKLQSENPGKFLDIIENYFKRITPSELASSAFFDGRPVRKKDVDAILMDVINHFAFSKAS